MPTKPMTEAQAWREVGRRIEEAERVAPETGLCLVLWGVVHDAGERPSWYGPYCPTRVMSYLPFNEAYAYDNDEWEGRVLAAYWLALEAEEDARAD